MCYMSWAANGAPGEDADGGTGSEGMAMYVDTLCNVSHVWLFFQVETAERSTLVKEVASLTSYLRQKVTILFLYAVTVQVYSC